MKNKEVAKRIRDWVKDPKSKWEWPFKSGDYQYARFAKYITKNWGKKFKTFNEFALDYADKIEKMKDKVL